MKKFTDFLAIFPIFLLSAMLGIIIIGQFIYGPITLIFGLLCAFVMLTNADKWGLIDLLLLRRLVAVVGLTTVLTIYITGLVLTHGWVGVAAYIILTAGTRTIPVYAAMCVSIFLTSVWHIWPSLDKLPDYPC